MTRRPPVRRAPGAVARAARLVACAALAGCASGGVAIEGRWAEPGACDSDRWRFADGVVSRTVPGQVRLPFNQRFGEVAAPWGHYVVQEDASVLLTRPAPGARAIVLLWLPRRDADGVVTGYTMELLEPGGRRYRVPAEPCPSPTALPLP